MPLSELSRQLAAPIQSRQHRPIHSQFSAAPSHAPKNPQTHQLNSSPSRRLGAPYPFHSHGPTHPQPPRAPQNEVQKHQCAQSLGETHQPDPPETEHVPPLPELVRTQRDPRSTWLRGAPHETNPSGPAQPPLPLNTHHAAKIVQSARPNSPHPQQPAKPFQFHPRKPVHLLSLTAPLHVPAKPVLARPHRGLHQTVSPGPARSPLPSEPHQTYEAT